MPGKRLRPPESVRFALVERGAAPIAIAAEPILELLAVCYRERGATGAAQTELAEVERIDPTSRLAVAERFFQTGDPAAKAELIRLLGGQSQEAMETSYFYRHLQRWNDATSLLQLVEQNNRDPYGTPPEFYYTLAWYQRRAGDTSAAAGSLIKARAAAGNIDRFPYRDDSEAPLAEAVSLDPGDAVARFALGCLLYYRDRQPEAIRHWEAAVAAHPDDFSLRRALGLAYAEQGAGVDKAAAQLERAVELNPAHVRTLNDLSTLYARAGRFDDQLNVLRNALDRSPNDDDLAEGMLTANLSKGSYDQAERLVGTHPFAPRHRSYSLRDKYRMMRYGMAAHAYHRKDYGAALDLFASAQKPPVSLGVDDFQFQASPRLAYYLGRTLEAQGRTADGRQSYQKAIAGLDQLSGDRDSWNSENFFMVLSLDRLGRAAEAVALEKHFENFAQSELEAKSREHRAEARYLMGLLRKHQHRPQEALGLIINAVEIQPDLLPARLELRGDVLDPLPGGAVDR